MTWIDDLVTFAQGGLDDRVRAALYGRGVSDDQIQAFRLGYLDRNLPSLPLEAEGFLRWCHRGAKLDDVLVLPLTTALGAIRGLQFRHVERDRTGYQDYIPYKEEPVLFGAVWGSGEALLVEGSFDLFPIQRHIPGTIATLTAGVSTTFAKFLRRIVKKVRLGYDADPTGRKAAALFQREYGREFEIQVIDYPRVTLLGANRYVKDPGELWEAWGDQRLGEFLRATIREFSDG
jgi:hypothetical protein